MSWSKCWLNYCNIGDYADKNLLKYIITIGDGAVIQNAAKELKLAIEEMLLILIPIKEQINADNHAEGCIILEVAKRGDIFVSDLHTEGFHIENKENNIYITGVSEQGVLYGVFEFLRVIRCKMPLKAMNKKGNPGNPLRILNHWDNIDGSIERGYAGNSIFFDERQVLINERTIDYARLCASIGINSVVINNVNVRGMATDLITNKYLKDLVKLADIFTGYGIKLYLSVNFAAPMEIGGLVTADPLNEEVIHWWNEQVKQIYALIPEFGGLLVKADSEFRPGPFTYNRTHADGANLLARALRPFGGLVIWRCFVYNCQQDWRDKKTDRAKAAYDNFMKLDGKFDSNVILQIKNGPMDFQVREPVSPLIGGLKRTNQLLELQITQEYTGQQKAVCYLVPLWKEILEFNTFAKSEYGTVADIVSGKTFGQTNCGMAAVANVGNDYNWTGHDLAAANWYGYGRLCWNTKLTAEEIATEWIKQTFSCAEDNTYTKNISGVENISGAENISGVENKSCIEDKSHEKQIVDTILKILIGSWHTYEKYTSPLGIGWMVNPNHHYGPNVDGYEYSKWGTYHRADSKGIGVDRTMNGTGYTAQYNEPNACMYENEETCPEELLLFFHYISYDYTLKSGKTLLQHIYDTHFEGAEEVEQMIAEWKSLKGFVDENVYQRVEERLEIQINCSKEWRDMINTYFYRKSGVDDIKSRQIYY